MSEETERQQEAEIDKEIEKLKYYLEPIDETIKEGDFAEIEVIKKRTDAIFDKVNNLVASVQELKIERGVETQRAIRQWKKDTKDKYGQWALSMNKLSEIVENRRREIDDEAERRKQHIQREKDEQRLSELREREKLMWEEKFAAELQMTERKIEMEKSSKSSLAKLPQLKITAFKGTAADWVRFENMFLTQIDKRPISDEEKFGYLLESVVPKVRDRISNLKPGTLGYKMAWDRLKQEYGQTKLVINAHLDEIINLAVVKGSNYERVQEFYEKLSNNYDALQTLGQGDMLQGFVITTLNKLPHVKPDLVRVDEEWEDWNMEDLIKNLQAWLRRNRVDLSSKPPSERRRDRNWFTRKNEGKQNPHCMFCQEEHWSDECKTLSTVEQRKKFFVEKNLCFNCGRAGHRGNQCRSRACFKCGSKHHTSLCDKTKPDKPSTTSTERVLHGYSTFVEEKSLPAIVPVKVGEETLWAFLDTGSGSNFISREAAKKLKLTPTHHVSKEIVTLNGVNKQSMPIYQVSINSLDGTVQEDIQVTGSKLSDFTTVRRPDISQLKQKFGHAKDKMFYMVHSGNYPIHLILGDKTYSKIRTERVLKGNDGDPVVEETTFGWLIHGGDDYSSDQCMFVRETNECKQLYSLDVLGVEDRSEQDQMEVLTDFRETVTRQEDGRYEVNIPWIPGAKLSATNEQPSRRRLANVNKRLSKDQSLKEEYEKIVKDQLASGIVERVPNKPTGERTYYMPHKPVIREKATTTKIRMVFDASAKPDPLANSINECMFTGPSLQPLLWDILIRARMTPNLLLADIQKAFLQIGVKETDRDAFRFLFEIDGKEEHFRFTRLPFGVEASPFLLGATLGYHLEQQPTRFEETVTALKENTYVDNIMKTGRDIDDLKKFKEESSIILEDAHFPIHKWESNIECLEDENMPNPSKILGHLWDKQEDTLEFEVTTMPENQPATKRNILSRLGRVYDPLGMVSPTMAEGKHLFREACDEKKSWNAEVSESLKRKWIKWNNQMKNVKVPRAITKKSDEIEGIQLHLFADASNLACCAATVAVVEHKSGTVKGLLTSKSRISKRNTSIPRLELVGAQMAANMARNLYNALLRLPIKTIIIWMDSMVALYWLCNPERPWKTFVANRVKKIAEITNEIGLLWKYCPSSKNLADLGSRGATIEKMVKDGWFTGPDWLLHVEQWPEQPQLKVNTHVSEESKPSVVDILFTKERELDEWDALLERSSYWRTLRVTAWALRFLHNCSAKRRKEKRKSGPIGNEEIVKAKNAWVRRIQRDIEPSLQAPGWELYKDENTNILKCKGRVGGYTPTYIEGGLFTEKLIAHTHNQIMHFGVANTMASLRETWWIPQLRSKVKKAIKNCNVCKLYSTKPYGATSTSAMPEFRSETSKPFESTGVDFAGPLRYKIDKKKEGKCYVLIFTCAVSRAVHLELTKSQEAGEFKRKLNAFIARRGRPRLMVSDNAATFKATAKWIKIIRKDEKLQDFLATQVIHWRFNLAKSPWWGGIYERLIREIKKTLYKTLGKSHLFFEGLESVVLDIESNMNNRPLTYVECEGGEQQVLTPNILIRGENSHMLDDVDDEEDELTKLQRRLKRAKDDAWKRWKREYLHSLLESQRVNNKVVEAPQIGDIVLVVGEEKNRGEWKKGKVLRHVRGKDGVTRGVVLLHKGHTIERPLQLICPLEIHCASKEQRNEVEEKEPENEKRPQRRAAKEAIQKIHELALLEED